MKNGLPQMLCFLQTAVCKVVVVFGKGHSFTVNFKGDIEEKNSYHSSGVFNHPCLLKIVAKYFQRTADFSFL